MDLHITGNIQRLLILHAVYQGCLEFPGIYIIIKSQEA
jgi:hypothetical protein